MTKKEKIEAIYSEMANKELTFGCRCIIKAQEPAGEDFLYRLCRGDERPISEIKEIIGHPVMIGDVLDWLDKKICLLIDQGKDIEKLLKGSDALNLRLINIWKYKTKPLDEQPDHCIDYVTNLLDKFGSVI